MGPARRIKILSDQLEHHNYKYFQENTPEINDLEYDQLMSELIDLENKFPKLKDPNSPSQRVGGAPSKGFVVARHKYSMLSISNTYTFEEIFDFENRLKSITDKVNNISYIAELKIDGVALSIVYEKGLLSRGITRGDGKQGDIVTDNVRTIKSIPLKINALKSIDYLEVRGEVYFTRRNFQQLNQKREDEGLQIFANPRNSAAGTLKMLDSKEVSKRNLRFFAYSIIKIDKKTTVSEIKTQDNILKILVKYGFDVNKNYKLCLSISEVVDFCNRWDSKRKNLGFETDGIVIKVNSLALHDELGSTAKSSRAIIAFKYATEEAETTLENIAFQVGRTGVVTPVAILKPAELGGTTVSRATLHNAEEITKKDIRIGDTVMIEKGGEIIPKVIKVVIKKRMAHSKQFIFPKNCPICDSILIQFENEVAIRCDNLNCSAQIIRRIEHFSSRTAMNIENLGPAIIEQLVKYELIMNYRDLYFLTKEKLLKLDRMAEKSVNNLLDSIKKSKSNSFAKLIYALGIRHIGINSAIILSHYSGSIEHLIKSKFEDLEKLDDIGPTMASSIILFFSNKENLSIIKGLEKAGLVMVETSNNKPTDNILNGKIFILTGTLNGHSREEMSEIIRSHGGKVGSSISNKTSYLLAGDNPGSKYQKAEKLGVPILQEKELLIMVNG